MFGRFFEVYGGFGSIFTFLSLSSTPSLLSKFGSETTDPCPWLLCLLFHDV